MEGLNSADFRFIINKTRVKLAGWGAELLIDDLQWDVLFMITSVKEAIHPTSARAPSQ